MPSNSHIPDAVCDRSLPAQLPGVRRAAAYPLLFKRANGVVRPLGGHPAPDGALKLRPVHALANGALQGAEATLDPARNQSTRQSAQDAVWLLYGACVQASKFDAPLSLSVPLAGAICDDDLVSTVRAALQRTGLSPGRLELALAGPAVADAHAAALLAMSALRDTGVGIALDHAGCGVAGLRLLRRLPVTSLRLHASLVAGLPHSRAARSAVAEAIEIAHAMDVSVVATGVRSPLQRDILADLRCDAAQGKLFGSHMPAADFRAALLHVTER